MQVKNIICRFSVLKLVIVRHGQSQCNLIKRWSGWSDSQLTAKGEADAVECAHLIKQEGLQFDLAYCSYLSRTIKTLQIILEQLHSLHLPVRKRWQLNQKFYGALQDMDKLAVVDQYGEKMVGQWRRSYHIAPPKVPPSDQRHPINDPRYKHVDPSLLPSTEHLGDVLARVKTLYNSQIKTELKNKKRLLIVCHGSVVRVLTNILLGFDYTQSSKFNVPNATPLVIDLDESLKGVRWKLLGDPSVIASKMKKIEDELKH